MKKIKSNKLAFTKKSIVELSNQELKEINGGSSNGYETPTLGVYTGTPLCGRVLEMIQ